MQEEITIEKAEKFLSDGEARSAGNLAGVLLEQSVQKLSALHQISLSNDLSTRDLLDRLRDAYVISREKNRELQNLVSIRNKCAHATPVTREEVQTLIQGTKKFICWVDSQSSIAPPRPLATPPLASRKHLVCPICGKDNRVRKVSGITHHELLKFPDFPSRSKIGRMINRERFCLFFGMLMSVIGFSTSCVYFPFYSDQPVSIWLLCLVIFVSSLFMMIVPFRIAAKRLQEDRLKAFEIWDTLYYCDRDDALYSSERPEYYVSAANMREMLRY